MKTNNLIMLGAGLVVAYVFLSKGGGEPKFYVEGVGYVLESQLSGYGYQMVNGQWYSAEQIAYATSQSGVPTGTTVDNSMEVWATILAVLDTVIPIIANATNSGSGGGD